MIAIQEFKQHNDLERINLEVCKCLFCGNLFLKQLRKGKVKTYVIHRQINAKTCSKVCSRRNKENQAKEYNQRDYVKARMKRYRDRADVKARKNERARINYSKNKEKISMQKKEYNQRDYVKARMKRYRDRADVKARRKEYDKNRRMRLKLK